MSDGRKDGGGDAPVSRLTPSERRCLELVDQGLQSKEIARVLDRSPNSVDTWLRSAARKLGVRDRFQAAKLLAASTKPAEGADVTPPSILRFQDSHIPPADVSGEIGVSAGKGNGPAELEPTATRRPAPHNAGNGKSFLEPSHPIARFFGGENRNSAARNILFIVAIAILISIAFTLVMSSYLGLSRLLSSP